MPLRGQVSAQVLQKLMRHRNIKTTMDFHANVDDAVRAEWNGLSNTRPPAGPTTEKAIDANPAHDGPSGLR
jgi:hypothetical protein